MLPILYSFRRCPYAMRARWTLLDAGLLVQWREVALKAKPTEMLAASPKGTVPVLVLADGTVIDESLAVMRWALNQADPRQLLNTGNSQELIQENDGPFKHHLDRFKYTDRYQGASKQEHQLAGNAILCGWNKRIADQGWLLDDRCSLADVALWPFVRQWRMADSQSFDSDPDLAALRQWLQRFLDDPRFERLMQRADPWSPGGQQHQFPADAIAVPRDQPLFHLALKDDWQAAQATGSYRISTRGMTLDQVGFIHCSWQEQVAATYQRFYADAGEVMLLEINPAAVDAPLRADAIPSGALFPHLYGALGVGAVRHAECYPKETG
jgi:glutathione S-transferase